MTWEGAKKGPKGDWREIWFHFCDEKKSDWAGSIKKEEKERKKKKNEKLHRFLIMMFPEEKNRRSSKVHVAGIDWFWKSGWLFHKWALCTRIAHLPQWGPKMIWKVPRKLTNSTNIWISLENRISQSVYSLFTPASGKKKNPGEDPASDTTVSFPERITWFWYTNTPVQTGRDSMIVLNGSQRTLIFLKLVRSEWDASPSTWVPF